MKDSMNGNELCEKCGGACCQVFSVNLTSQELKGKLKGHNKQTKKWITEDIVEITLEEAIATGVIKTELEGSIDSNKFYTCRQFDKVTGKCKDYENRPYVCSRFPYPEMIAGKASIYKSCNLLDHLKQELVTPVRGLTR